MKLFLRKILHHYRHYHHRLAIVVLAPIVVVFYLHLGKSPLDYFHSLGHNNTATAHYFIRLKSLAFGSIDLHKATIQHFDCCLSPSFAATIADHRHSNATAAAILGYCSPSITATATTATAATAASSSHRS